MIITNLASGSKGNSTIVETSSINILIDAGLPFSNLSKRLDKNFPKIDVLVLTHTHSDHIKGLDSFLKKYSPLLITTENEKEEKTKKIQKY